MEGTLKIRYKVILATEHFDGKYHTGDDRAYGPAVPIEISKDGDTFRWLQLPFENKVDPAIPLGGECTVQMEDVALIQGRGGPLVGVLTGLKVEFLPEFKPQDSGVIDHRLNSVALKQREQKGAYSSIRPNLKGRWTVLENSFKYSLGEGMGSGWKFKTSTCDSLAIVAGISGGTLVLTNPAGTDVSFTMGGGGVGLSPTKALKILKQMAPEIKAILRVAKETKLNIFSKTHGASDATADMWSAGTVLKNPLWYKGWSRAMTRQDFVGLAGWVEGNLVVGYGGGIQIFVVGITLAGGFRAIIPMAGEQRLLNVGAGAFICGLG